MTDTPKQEPTPILDDELNNPLIKKTATRRRWLHEGYDKNDDNWGW